MKYTEKVNFKTTPEQLKLIDAIAEHYGKSRADTIRDMLNMFILITESNVTLRDLIIAAAPALADRLIEDDVEIAAAILEKPDPGITDG